MSFKATAILCLIVAMLSAGFTRYYFPAIQTKTVTTEKEVVKNNIVTVTRTVKSPAGEVDTTTTTTDHSLQVVSDKNSSLTLKKPTLNVSALVGVDWDHDGDNKTGYGVSVTKEILGPVTVGAFGLTNGLIGVSIGIDF